MEHRLSHALRRLPPATLVGGLRDGAHVVLWQETDGIRRHVLDRATDRASCAGAWDGLDEPLATVLRERLPPGTFRGWPGGWIHLSFDGRWQEDGHRPPPASPVSEALHRLDLLPPSGTLARIEAPRSAHARLADGGRHAALATDPRLRALLWGSLPTDATLLLRRRGDRLAWAVEDRILGCVLGGASALPVPSPP
jgi:hypothetical protein